MKELLLNFCFNLYDTGNLTYLDLIYLVLNQQTRQMDKNMLCIIALFQPIFLICVFWRIQPFPLRRKSYQIFILNSWLIIMDLFQQYIRTWPMANKWNFIWIECKIPILIWQSWTPYVTFTNKCCLLEFTLIMFIFPGCLIFI